MITIRRISEVDRDFIKVPMTVNRSSEKFVPALQLDVKNVLNSRKNPFWKNCKREMLVVYRSGLPVARGIVHFSGLHQELYQDNCAYFGYTDFIEDSEVFDALMKTIIDWAVEQGAEKIVGPLNPSINYELGVLSAGFGEAPCFMMTYNPAYYRNYFENFGFGEAMKFYAYSVPNVIHRQKIDRVVDLIKKRSGAVIEEIDFRNFKAEAIQLCRIYNDAFSGHYGFIPFSEEEFLYVAKDMNLIMNKRLIFKVKVADEVAGFILALPNMNEVIIRLKEGKIGVIGIIKLLYYKRKIKRVKVMVAAIKKKYQHLGLGSLLYAEMADRVKYAGYEGGELSWVAAENTKMNEIIKEMGGEKVKEYLLFQLNIGNR